MQETGRQITVAVVEDNPRIRELLQEEISDEGHRFCHSGQRRISSGPWPTPMSRWISSFSM